MLLKWEGFQYAMSLDLNMGYYHIRLTEDASNLCTIILPWGKYRYKRLPIGVSNSPEISQQKTKYLFQGFEFIRACIDGLLILTNGDWKDHVHKLELTLNEPKEMRLRCVLKSFYLNKPKWNIWFSG